MKSMIRFCHPPTPHVGLTRQSCDHSRTMMHYFKAKKRRDTFYFHSMLRTMTQRIRVYRLIRGLWLKAIRRIDCPYLKTSILDLLQMKRAKRPPIYFTRYHELHLDYTQLDSPRRFTQMIGRLVSLGFPDRPIPVVDYEYEAYLSKFPSQYHSRITSLYQQLCSRNIEEKWHIVLSNLPLYYQYDFTDWSYFVNSNRLSLILSACHRQSPFSPEEYQLLTTWIERMKYPSHLTI